MIFILNILIISGFCAGLARMTEEGMLLEKAAERFFCLLSGMTYSEYKATTLYDPDKVNKLKSVFIYMPIIGCVYCMASFWGSVIYWALMLFVWQVDITAGIWIMWPITCVICVFTNGLFYCILKSYERFT